MVSQSNMMKVLAVYALIVGIGLPYVVGRWWKNAKKYTKNKILNLTMELFYGEMKERMTVRQLIEVLTAAVEFRDEIPLRKSDEQGLVKVRIRGIHDYLD